MYNCVRPHAITRERTSKRDREIKERKRLRGERGIMRETETGTGRERGREFE